eukprot:TRINITY_DN705_c3_g1_i1.p1 TRINITY_DN705_c3_g1~~TRINITY_DN705_c3_g1_i1.p1  ORF type:complete len:256 (-),score=48.56 TRINITY_DN705_c3_g1_i1:92-859(-)
MESQLSIIIPHPFTGDEEVLSPKKRLLNRYLFEHQAEVYISFAAEQIHRWLARHDRQHHLECTRVECEGKVQGTLQVVSWLIGEIKASPQLLLANLHYADMFVARHGLKMDTLFDLLLASTMVSVKFWAEEYIDINAIVAAHFNIPLKDVNTLEMRFVQALDFKLYMSEKLLSSLHMLATEVRTPQEPVSSPETLQDHGPVPDESETEPEPEAHDEDEQDEDDEERQPGPSLPTHERSKRPREHARIWTPAKRHR